MRIVMIGAGAMGSTFGARFAATGEEVVLFDTDEVHVAAIVADGLNVSTPGGDLRLRLPATTAVDEVGPADLAVILVDSNATADAAAVARRVLAPEGFAVTLQNGIGNVEALSEALGAERVVGGTTYNSAARIAPGRVLHSNIGDTTVGELDGRTTERIGAIADLFGRAGLPTSVSGNIVGHIWMKFVLNAAINPVSAVTGLRPGEIARTGPALALLESLIDEILAVVAAKGISLPDPDPRGAVLDHAWERYNRPSMLQHVETGRRTEIDSLNGALLREADQLGVACPVNHTVTQIVRAIDTRSLLRRRDEPLDEASLEAGARSRPRPRT